MIPLKGEWEKSWNGSLEEYRVSHENSHTLFYLKSRIESLRDLVCVRWRKCLDQIVLLLSQRYIWGLCFWFNYNGTNVAILKDCFFPDFIVWLGIQIQVLHDKYHETIWTQILLTFIQILLTFTGTTGQKDLLCYSMLLCMLKKQEFGVSDLAIGDYFQLSIKFWNEFA